jgi:L-ornithine Nalpha-acyltransferase
MTPMTDATPPARHLEVRLAASARDLRAAQRLRYRVFVEELGAGGPLVDHGAALEIEAQDHLFDHMLLIDPSRDAAALDDVVGVYRLLPQGRARFYSEAEYDLAPLVSSGRRLLEVGRSCVHPAYRGGAGVLHLWAGVADYVLGRGFDVMFGVASFPGTNPAAHAQALSWLYHTHRAPAAIRPVARPGAGVRMDMLPPDAVDPVAAAAGLPALLRGYLRLGGKVGEGAFVDRVFNTVDVCLIVDVASMSARHLGRYRRRQGLAA